MPSFTSHENHEGKKNNKSINIMHSNEEHVNYGDLMSRERKKNE